MALAAFEQMHARLFARLGEQAVLREIEPCRVNIEKGVTVQTEIGDPKFYQSELAVVVDIANVLSKLAPKPGDALTITASGDDYIIDAIAADNGYMARCVLRSV